MRLAIKMLGFFPPNSYCWFVRTRTNAEKMGWLNRFDNCTLCIDFDFERAMCRREDFVDLKVA
jgi:hypothetical protein